MMDSKWLRRGSQIQPQMAVAALRVTNRPPPNPETRGRDGYKLAPSFWSLHFDTPHARVPTTNRGVNPRRVAFSALRPAPSPGAQEPHDPVLDLAGGRRATLVMICLSFLELSRAATANRIATFGTFIFYGIVYGTFADVDVSASVVVGSNQTDFYHCHYALRATQKSTFEKTDTRRIFQRATSSQVSG